MDFVNILPTHFIPYAYFILLLVIKYLIKFNTRDPLFIMYYWSSAVLLHWTRLRCLDLHWAAGFSHILHPSALFALLRPAMNCRVQSYTAPYCTSLHCILINCTALHCTALHWNVSKREISLYLCYYPHTSGESMSPVCAIFLKM